MTTRHYVVPIRKHHFLLAGRRSRKTSRAVMLLCSCLAAAAGRAQAQVVSGTLTTATDGNPVQSASVILLDLRGRQVTRTATDTAGLFRIEAGRAGAYWLRIEPPGYQMLATQPFTLEQGDSLAMDLQTLPQVLTLEGVTSGATGIQNRNYAGFLDRQHYAFMGRFLTPDDIRMERAARASDLLLMKTPGLDVDEDRNPFFRNRGRVCKPTLLIDGYPAWDALDRAVSGAEVRAVEIYPYPEFAPLELTTTPFNACGVIAIWTAFGLGIDH